MSQGHRMWKKCMTWTWYCHKMKMLFFWILFYQFIQRVMFPSLNSFLGLTNKHNLWKTFFVLFPDLLIKTKIQKNLNNENISFVENIMRGSWRALMLSAFLKSWLQHRIPLTCFNLDDNHGELPWTTVCRLWIGKIPPQSLQLSWYLSLTGK